MGCRRISHSQEAEGCKLVEVSPCSLLPSMTSPFAAHLLRHHAHDMHGGSHGLTCQVLKTGFYIPVDVGLSPIGHPEKLLVNSCDAKCCDEGAPSWNHVHRQNLYVKSISIAAHVAFASAFSQLSSSGAPCASNPG